MGSGATLALRGQSGCLASSLDRAARSGRHAPSPWLLCALIALFLASLACPHVASASPSTIDGASQASCEPSPCQPATEVQTVTLPSAISNDDGTASTREYGVDRPQSLVGLAPAVLVFYGGGMCGVKPVSRFAQLAPANRFLVVYMAIPCEREEKFWQKRNIDATTTAGPDDEPYVNAVVADITRCPGECVDPRRVYAAGMSSGGSMVADVMCDAQNSSLFRGYMIDSSSLQTFAGAPHCPSTNRSFFTMLTLSNSGLDAGIYYDTNPSPHLDVPAFAEWAASRLGCAAPLQVGAIGSPLPSTLTYSYVGPCAYASAGSVATMSLGVIDGAHGWSCQDSDPGAVPYECPTMPTPPGLDENGLPMTNGLFAEGQFWSFIAEGTSSSEPAPPLSETTPPLVTLTAPDEGASVAGTVTIGVHASDDTALASVRLQLDGSPLGVPSPAAAGEGDYSLSWDSRTVANGEHTLRAIAVDAAGNLSLASVGFTVANTPEGGSGGGPGSGGGSSSESGSGSGAGSGGAGESLGSAGGGAPVSPSSEVGLGGVAPTTDGVFGEPPRWVALGDDYAAGEDNGPYLPGSDTTTDRCHRSSLAYPLLAALSLGVPAPGLHACGGAGVAVFYGANDRDHEPRQLGWLSRVANLVTVSVGWNDAAMTSAIERCGRALRRCRAGWSPNVDATIASLGGSRNPMRSLRRLFATIAAAAPNASVIAVGYPHPFAGRPSSPCRIPSRRLRFDPAGMRWVNREVKRLDRAIETAAQAAGASFLKGSFGAFAGHELCTRHPYVDGALVPSRQGQAAIAKLLAKALSD